MNEKGDNICPLCTEEMDLTDQQLKPCKCGYEICVWCWNHIMEMAEKDNTEGRCPACRTPYDKEKIVGMAASCERLVAEMSSERKLKSQKLKPKISEERMYLVNVRVIQRNLVYIIGLPLNLADEVLLQQKEYFGQYGKVLKVSISRTATGVIQHSSNKSCCVYITYAKEEEAVCCIQSVHSYVLEGRSLRACFGTTKYCHAWLRNMPCTISDCLYLHDFGSQEDSFTKDDLVSAFTRSKVQQIIGATNNLHRRSGNVLPPPADEYGNRNMSSIAKPNSENSSDSIGNFDTGSCADNGTGRFSVLPGSTSWVTRVSVSVPRVASVSSSGGSSNHKPEASNNAIVIPSDAVSSKSYSDVKRTMIPERNGERNSSFLTSSDNLPCMSESHDIPGDIAAPAFGESSLEFSEPSCVPGLPGDEYFHSGGDIEGLCSRLPTVSIGNDHKDEFFHPFTPASGISNHNLFSSQGSQSAGGQFSEPLTAPGLRESMIVEDLLDFDGQHLETFGGAHHVPLIPCSKQTLKQSSSNSWQHEVHHQNTTDAHPSVEPFKHDEVVFPMAPSNVVSSKGFYDNQANGFTQLDWKTNYSSSSLEVGEGKYLKQCDCNVVNDDTTGEGSIISNILSMDFEECEDFSLTSLQGLLKLLTETDEQHNFLKKRTLRKLEDGNQSRFSFARQDDLLNQSSNMEHSFENEMSKFSPSNYFMENEDMHKGKYCDSSSKTCSLEPIGFLNSHSITSPKFSVSKAPKSSPPPGFAVSSRVVPPGFSTHGTHHHAFDHSVDHLPQNSASPSRNVGSWRDVEFIDPAISEVHKGDLATGLNNPCFDTGAASSPQLSPLDHDIELQKMMMQQSTSAQQNLRFPDNVRNMFSFPNGSYNNSPRLLLGQSPPNNPSLLAEMAGQQLGNLHMWNDHWGGWNEMKRITDVGASESITNGRMGFNKYIPSYESLKYQMSSSSNAYNRGFAM